MITSIQRKHATLTYRLFSAFLMFTFVFSSIIPPQRAYSQTLPASPLGGLNLPTPGTMIPLSPTFNPPIIKGITIHPENPLLFDFIVHPGDDHLKDQELKEESIRLIKYFMASLTVPEDQMWVNLSPYEEDRIIPNEFGKTEMGKDLLAQDYLLKQLTASLMYPEDELGGDFWNRVYEKAYEQYGTTEIPLNTFNKIWIMPETASIYEHGTSVFVVDSHLKVMLDSDYQAMNESSAISHQSSDDTLTTDDRRLKADNLELSEQIIREIIVPAIEQEVNTGKTFANLRQIYHSVILATWYKQNLKESLLGQVYIDQNKTKGIDTEDKQIKEKIYNQYLEAFKVGVYNYIKEDYDPATQEIIPRKYFSGGVGLKSPPLSVSSPMVQPFEGTLNVTVEFDAIGDAPIDIASASSPVVLREIEILRRPYRGGNHVRSGETFTIPVPEEFDVFPVIEIQAEAYDLYGREGLILLFQRIALAETSGKSLLEQEYLHRREKITQFFPDPSPFIRSGKELTVQQGRQTRFFTQFSSDQYPVGLSGVFLLDITAQDEILNATGNGKLRKNGTFLVRTAKSFERRGSFSEARKWVVREIFVPVEFDQFSNIAVTAEAAKKFKPSELERILEIIAQDLGGQHSVSTRSGGREFVSFFEELPSNARLVIDYSKRTPRKGLTLTIQSSVPGRKSRSYGVTLGAITAAQGQQELNYARGPVLDLETSNFSVPAGVQQWNALLDEITRDIRSAGSLETKGFSGDRDFKAIRIGENVTLIIEMRSFLGPQSYIMGDMYLVEDDFATAFSGFEQGDLQIRVRRIIGPNRIDRLQSFIARSHPAQITHHTLWKAQEVYPNDHWTGILENLDQPASIFSLGGSGVDLLADQIVEELEEVLRGLSSEELRQVRILNTAFGLGRVMGEIRERFPEIDEQNLVGIDLNPELVKRARSLGLNVQQGDVRSMPFDDESFDIIVDAGLPTYSVVPFEVGNEILEEMNRVLRRPDRRGRLGLLILTGTMPIVPDVQDPFIHPRRRFERQYTVLKTSLPAKMFVRGAGRRGFNKEFFLLQKRIDAKPLLADTQSPGGSRLIDSGAVGGDVKSERFLANVTTLNSLIEGERDRVRAEILREAQKLVREGVLHPLSSEELDAIMRQDQETGFSHIYRDSDGRLLGFVLAQQVDYQTVRIEKIGVQQGVRRNRIGTRLVYALARQADALGINRVDLLVMQNNPEAVQAYERWGFENLTTSEELDYKSLANTRSSFHAFHFLASADQLVLTTGGQLSDGTMLKNRRKKGAAISSPLRLPFDSSRGRLGRALQFTDAQLGENIIGDMPTASSPARGSVKPESWIDDGRIAELDADLREILKRLKTPDEERTKTIEKNLEGQWVESDSSLSLALSSAEDVLQLFPIFPEARQKVILYENGPKRIHVEVRLHSDDDVYRYMNLKLHNLKLFDQYGTTVQLFPGDFINFPGMAALEKEGLSSDIPEEVIIGRLSRLWFRHMLFPWLANRGFDSLRIGIISDSSERFFRELGGKYVSEPWMKIDLTSYRDIGIVESEETASSPVWEGTGGEDGEAMIVAPTEVLYQYNFPVEVFSPHDVLWEDGDLRTRLSRLYYFRHRDESGMEFAVERIQNLNGIQTGLQSFMENHYPELQVVSISVMGSYLWRQEYDDIDVQIVVEDDFFDFVKIDAQEILDDIFKETVNFAMEDFPSLDVTVIGRENLEQGVIYKNRHHSLKRNLEKVVHISRTDSYMRNFVFKGRDFVEIPNNLRNSLRTIFSFLNRSREVLLGNRMRALKANDRYRAVLRNLLDASMRLNFLLERQQIDVISIEKLINQIDENITNEQVAQVVEVYKRVLEIFEDTLAGRISSEKIGERESDSASSSVEGMFSGDWRQHLNGLENIDSQEIFEQFAGSRGEWTDTIEYSDGIVERRDAQGNVVWASIPLGEHKLEIIRFGHDKGKYGQDFGRFAVWYDGKRISREWHLPALNWWITEPDDPHSIKGERTLFLDTLDIHSDFQRKGIGSALLRWISQSAREQGVVYYRNVGTSNADLTHLHWRILDPDSVEFHVQRLESDSSILVKGVGNLLPTIRYVRIVKEVKTYSQDEEEIGLIEFDGDGKIKMYRDATSNHPWRIEQEDPPNNNIYYAHGPEGQKMRLEVIDGIKVRASNVLTGKKYQSGYWKGRGIRIVGKLKPISASSPLRLVGTRSSKEQRLFSEAELESNSVKEKATSNNKDASSPVVVNDQWSGVSDQRLTSNDRASSPVNAQNDKVKISGLFSETLSLKIREGTLFVKRATTGKNQSFVLEGADFDRRMGSLAFELFWQLMEALEHNQQQFNLKSLIDILNVNQIWEEQPESYFWQTTFEDVFGELLYNAINVTVLNDDMREVGEIGIDAVIKEGNLILSVRDDGPGITNQVKRSMFELRFSTRRSEGDDDSPGYGLARAKFFVEKTFGDKAQIRGDNNRDLGLDQDGATFRIIIQLEEVNGASNNLKQGVEPDESSSPAEAMLGEHQYREASDREVSEFRKIAYPRYQEDPKPLVVDERGLIFVVKQKKDRQVSSVVQYMIRNDFRCEMLAYLIGQGRVNTVEIRRILSEEVTEIPNLSSIPENKLQDYYLSRLTTTYQSENLVFQDANQARSAQLVFETLIRKWDHHEDNQSYVGDVPLIFDNDEGFNRTFIDNSFNIFSFVYQQHLYGSTLSSDLRDHRRKELRAVSSLDGYDIEQIRRSIQEFQNLNFRVLAIQAGYRGTDLEEVVHFLDKTQKTLYEDVEFLLGYITKEYDFKLTDAAIRARPEVGGASSPVDKTMTSKKVSPTKLGSKHIKHKKSSWRSDKEYRDYLTGFKVHWASEHHFNPSTVLKRLFLSTLELKLTRRIASVMISVAISFTIQFINVIIQTVTIILPSSLVKGISKSMYEGLARFRIRMMRMPVRPSRRPGVIRQLEKGMDSADTPAQQRELGRSFLRRGTHTRTTYLLEGLKEKLASRRADQASDSSHFFESDIYALSSELFNILSLTDKPIHEPKDIEIINFLIGLLSDERVNEWELQATIRGFGQITEYLDDVLRERILKHFYALLGHPSEIVRGATARLLHEVFNFNTLEVVLERLNSEPSLRVQTYLIDTVDILIKELNINPDNYGSPFHIEDITDPLIERATDPDAIVELRVGSIRALGELSWANSKILEPIRTLLISDPDLWVQEASLRALDQLTTKPESLQAEDADLLARSLVRFVQGQHGGPANPLLEKYAHRILKRLESLIGRKYLIQTEVTSQIHLNDERLVVFMVDENIEQGDGFSTHRAQELRRQLKGREAVIITTDELRQGRDHTIFSRSGASLIRYRDDFMRNIRNLVNGLPTRVLSWDPIRRKSVKRFDRPVLAVWGEPIVIIGRSEEYSDIEKALGRSLERVESSDEIRHKVIERQLEVLIREPRSGVSRELGEEILRDLSEGTGIIKGEDIDVIKIDTKNGGIVAVGPLDRGIIHKYGLLHRNAKAFVRTPEGKFLMPQRTHQMFEPYRLTIFGGHSSSGKSYADAINRELIEEFGFPSDWQLKGQFELIGEEGGFASKDTRYNNELRTVYIYHPTKDELRMIREFAAELRMLKRRRSPDSFRKWLEEKRAEVWSIHELTLQELLDISHGETVTFIDTFRKEETLERQAELTSFFLKPLMDDPIVINALMAAVNSLGIKGGRASSSVLHRTIRDETSPASALSDLSEGESSPIELDGPIAVIGTPEIASSPLTYVDQNGLVSVEKIVKFSDQELEVVFNYTNQRLGLKDEQKHMKLAFDDPKKEEEKRPINREYFWASVIDVGRNKEVGRIAIRTRPYLRWERIDVYRSKGKGYSTLGYALGKILLLLEGYEGKRITARFGRFFNDANYSRRAYFKIFEERPWDEDEKRGNEVVLGANIDISQALKSMVERVQADPKVMKKAIKEHILPDGTLELRDIDERVLQARIQAPELQSTLEVTNDNTSFNDAYTITSNGKEVGKMKWQMEFKEGKLPLMNFQYLSLNPDYKQQYIESAIFQWLRYHSLSWGDNVKFYADANIPDVLHRTWQIMDPESVGISIQRKSGGWGYSIALQESLLTSLKKFTVAKRFKYVGSTLLEDVIGHIYFNDSGEIENFKDLKGLDWNIMPKSSDGHTSVYVANNPQGSESFQFEVMDQLGIRVTDQESGARLAVVYEGSRIGISGLIKDDKKDGIDKIEIDEFQARLDNNFDSAIATLRPIQEFFEKSRMEDELRYRSNVRLIVRNRILVNKKVIGWVLDESREVPIYAHPNGRDYIIDLSLQKGQDGWMKVIKGSAAVLSDFSKGGSSPIELEGPANGTAPVSNALNDLHFASAILNHGEPLSLIDDRSGIDIRLRRLRKIFTENHEIGKSLLKKERRLNYLIGGEFFSVLLWQIEAMILLEYDLLKGPHDSYREGRHRKLENNFKNVLASEETKSAYYSDLRDRFIQWSKDLEESLRELEEFIAKLGVINQEAEPGIKEDLIYVKDFAQHYIPILRIIRAFLSEEIPDDLSKDVIFIKDLNDWLSQQEWQSKGKEYPVRTIPNNLGISIQSNEPMLQRSIERMVSNGFDAIEDIEDELREDQQVVTIRDEISINSDGQEMARIIVRNPGAIDEDLLAVDERHDLPKLFVFNPQKNDQFALTRGVGLKFALRSIQKMGGTVRAQNVAEQGESYVELVVEFPVHEQESLATVTQINAPRGGSNSFLDSRSLNDLPKAAVGAMARGKQNAASSPATQSDDTMPGVDQEFGNRYVYEPVSGGQDARLKSIVHNDSGMPLVEFDYKEDGSIENISLLHFSTGEMMKLVPEGKVYSETLFADQRFNLHLLDKNELSEKIGYITISQYFSDDVQDNQPKSLRLSRIFVERMYAEKRFGVALYNLLALLTREFYLKGQEVLMESITPNPFAAYSFIRVSRDWEGFNSDEDVLQYVLIDPGITEGIPRRRFGLFDQVQSRRPIFQFFIFQDMATGQYKVEDISRFENLGIDFSFKNGKIVLNMTNGKNFSDKFFIQSINPTDAKYKYIGEDWYRLTARPKPIAPTSEVVDRWKQRRKLQDDPVMEKDDEGFDAASSPVSDSTDVGGIDLNPQAIKMDKRGVGVNFPLPTFDPEQFQNGNIEGFLPVIINISPVTNIPLLLGLTETEEKPTDLGFESLDPLEKRDRFKSEQLEQLSLLN